jgi:hypothetical protein
MTKHLERIIPWDSRLNTFYKYDSITNINYKHLNVDEFEATQLPMTFSGDNLDKQGPSDGW